MRRTMSDYPVGSTWEAINDEGSCGKIWLEKRSENIEMWMFLKE